MTKIIYLVLQALLIILLYFIYLYFYHIIYFIYHFFVTCLLSSYLPRLYLNHPETN